MKATKISLLSGKTLITCIYLSVFFEAKIFYEKWSIRSKFDPSVESIDSIVSLSEKIRTRLIVLFDLKRGLALI